MSASTYAATLDEVGRELGVTRERVRQIEISALAKVRRALCRIVGPVEIADIRAALRGASARVEQPEEDDGTEGEVKKRHGAVHRAAVALLRVDGARADADIAAELGCDPLLVRRARGDWHVMKGRKPAPTRAVAPRDLPRLAELLRRQGRDEATIARLLGVELGELAA